MLILLNVSKLKILLSTPVLQLSGSYSKIIAFIVMHYSIAVKQLILSNKMKI